MIERIRGLKEAITSRRDERAYHHAVTILDLTGDIQGALERAQLDPELGDYPTELMKIRKTILLAKDNPEEVFFGTARNVPLIEGSDWPRSPGRYTYDVNLSHLIVAPDEKANTLFTHVLQVAGEAMEIPGDERQKLVQEARRSYDAHQQYGAVVQLNGDWKMVINFGRRGNVANVILEPVAKSEYFEHWRDTHREDLREEITLEKVREAMREKSAKEYHADNVNLAQRELVYLGSMEDVRGALEQAGWEPITDEDLLQFVRQTPSNAKEIYRHKESQDMDPYLGIKEYNWKIRRGGEEIFLSAIASPGYKDQVKREFYQQFQVQLFSEVDKYIALRKEQHKDEPLAVRDIIDDCLEALGQHIDSYDENEELPLLGKMAVTALARQLAPYPKLRQVVDGLDIVRMWDESADNSVDFGWHPEEITIKLSPEDFTS